MEPVRIGVAGLGFGAAVHLPALQSLPNVSVVGLAGTRIDAARTIATKAGVANAVGSWQELLDLDLDAVTFALPPLENERACRAALERRVPVLSEKPLASSLAAARELERLATGIPASVDFEFGELEAFRRLEQMVASRRLGNVRHVQINWFVESYAHRTKGWSWKTDRSRGGGVTALLVSHLFYLLDGLFGPVSLIRSRMSNRATAAFTPSGCSPAEDFVDLWLSHPGGVTTSVTCSNSMRHGTGHRWDILCDEGSLTLQNSTADYMKGFELTSCTRSGSRIEYADDATLSGADGRIAPVREIARRFIDAVRSGSTASPDFSAGVRVQELMERATGDAMMLSAHPAVGGEVGDGHLSGSAA